MCTQILKALELAHSHNLYHGDLKPSNLIVDKWYNIQICDFGVTKANNGVNIRSGGDINYMCPHQLNINHSDKESDFFALGLVLFEAIFKKLPFGKANTEEDMLKLIDKGVNWREVYAANGNQELINLIKKLLSRTNKYKHTQEVLIDLSKILYEKAEIEDLGENESKENNVIYMEDQKSKKTKRNSKKILVGSAVIALVSIMVLGSL